jgi:uncharacterized RDD family membrane protein YckC
MLSDPILLVKRIVALILDSLLLFIVNFIVGFVLGSILGDVGGLIGFAFTFVVGAAYQWYFLTKNNGQTLGKQLLGIRVVSAGGGKISDVEAVVRYAGYYVNTFVLFLGWIWGAISGRGFHDYLAGTKVVDA